MNTSKLQAFATDARRQLMNAVRARLDAALVPNSDAQVDDPRAFAFLQREIERAGGGVEGRKHVVERYAYRWFNRIIAFRYMDVHGFTGTPVVSPAVLTSTNGLPEVLAARAVIVIAGMEGALASVVGGLVPQPVVAVPTSVGYGASFAGLSALLGMLTSCASGVTVTNIDNGFGAACAACRIINACEGNSKT